jgi:hypothetical protein
MEVVAERRLETHRTAMALASPNVRVAHHVACVSCSDHRPVLVIETDLNTNVSLNLSRTIHKKFAHHVRKTHAQARCKL